MNIKWHKWQDRKSIPNNNQPAVYYIAYSPNENIDGRDFSYEANIVYIGVTTSKDGVNDRLTQFEITLKNWEGEKKDYHGGAQRAKAFLKQELKMKSPEDFIKHAFVSVLIFDLSNLNSNAEKWRKKAECIKHEYISFAEYIENKHTDELPKFNSYKKEKKTS